MTRTMRASISRSRGPGSALWANAAGAASINRFRRVSIPGHYQNQRFTARRAPRYDETRMQNENGLRERKKIATRRRILRAGDKLFQELGFAATTLERIAARAGVHKQTVLRYFGSKDEIALEFRNI